MRRYRPSFVALAFAGAFALPSAHAIDLIAIGTVDGSTDKSGLSGMLENGVDAANVLGGMGSALTWAGHGIFLALPDRGPNATAYPGGEAVDQTTSYVPRFHTLRLTLAPAPAGAPLPYTLETRLLKTTLLSSRTPLAYGPVVPEGNTKRRHPFSGRSDNFAAGTDSVDPDNARLDPEGLRLSPDRHSVYVSAEYGPHVYRFDLATGMRLQSYALPAAFSAANLSGQGAAEIAGNTTGRVANKGMEGLAITPDGKTLVGFEQSPLLQDGGDGGRANRIVAIDVETGATRQYVYDNFVAETGKAYNSSELLALNDHEFLVLERDGKGRGDDSSAKVKRLYKIDLAGASDIGALNGGAGISGEAALLPYAVPKTLFLDLVAVLGAHGIAATEVPSKLEGLAFGDDLVEDGKTWHTLYVASDNDFRPDTSGPNEIYVFRFDDADLAGSTFENQRFERCRGRSCAPR